jgi:tRNA A37 threonylcarbamoyladenosine biosynthesis protein TsaE
MPIYRLKSSAELDALGWDEILATADVLLVEWPERAAGRCQHMHCD